jgi:hypothetical protein
MKDATPRLTLLHFVAASQLKRLDLMGWRVFYLNSTIDGEGATRGQELVRFPFRERDLLWVWV